LEKIGTTAYKLHLPPSAAIYPIFHVNQLKQHIGQKDVPQTNLNMVTVEGYIKIEPETILETRALPRHVEIITQWKVQWQNIPPEQATWEDKLFIKSAFPPEFYTKTIKE
jgi:hypothetical protein